MDGPALRSEEEGGDLQALECLRNGEAGPAGVSAKDGANPAG